MRALVGFGLTDDAVDNSDGVVEEEAVAPLTGAPVPTAPLTERMTGLVGTHVRLNLEVGLLHGGRRASRTLKPYEKGACARTCARGLPCVECRRESCRAVFGQFKWLE